ncbi:MAG: L-fucose:H+ symporter permease [Planctomycetaceae bacterium]|nr:L-fucose:H+ symporter permease [Planctomycetaceae bacterium]
MPESPSASAPVVPRKYLFAFALVTSLFALWGFANDVTNPLVKVFKEIFLLSNEQSAWVQRAFYGGYATMAIPAALVIRKFSYKSGIIVGLLLYATGALLFIPASSRMSYGLFLGALYILTFGLAFLETAANPYILSMGPPETATRRLNLAQAFNPLGSLVGMLVMSQVILTQLQIEDFRQAEKKAHPEYLTMLPDEVDAKISDSLQEFAEEQPTEHQAMQSHDLGVVRIPYVSIALVVIGVLVVFALSKMPDTGHEEDPIHLFELLGRLATFRYLGGVVAQTFYVGAQIMCWTFIIHYGVTLLGMEASRAQQWNIGAMCTFITGRWLGTLFLLPRVRPGTALGTLAIGGLIATAAAIFTPGIPGIVCVVSISLFMSVMFPTIYGIALQGLTPNDAKLGSAGLIFAIVGGALMPPWQAAIIDGGPVTLAGYTLPAVRASFFLPLGCFIVIAIYGFLVARLKSPQIDVA